MSMQSTVQKIVNKLTEMDRPVVNFLGEPLARDNVLERIISMGLESPEELNELYETHNGTRIHQGDRLDDLHFFPGFYWLSLDDASEIYRSISKDERWSKSWFPVFANGGGDFYAVDCKKNSSTFGAVIGFMLGEQDHPIEFENLKGMIQTIDDCFSFGAYFVANGFLDADDALAQDLAKKNNPSLPFYDEV